jgi:hypothetical protein
MQEVFGFTPPQRRRESEILCLCNQRGCFNKHPAQIIIRL